MCGVIEVQGWYLAVLFIVSKKKSPVGSATIKTLRGCIVPL